MPAGQLGQPVQLIGRTRVIVDGRLRDIGADQHHGRAERGHQLELVLGAAQVAPEQVFGYRLEVAEWLVQQDAQAQVRGTKPHLRG